MKKLEVIVTSVAEALNAQEGGADRLELVSDLASEGLTPQRRLIEEVLESVSIPVRIMLRETTSHSIKDADVQKLQHTAEAFSQFPIGGFVLGFLRDDAVDSALLEELLPFCADVPVTFHRAIEAVADPFRALETLKQFPQIDRVLLNGGSGSWDQRRSRLEQLQAAAYPELTLITGGGLTEGGLRVLAQSSSLIEFHTGSAVRDAAGSVCKERVSRLRRILGSAQ